jgi:hypothetical protein
MTRGRAFRLQLLMVLASADIFGSESVELVTIVSSHVKVKDKVKVTSRLAVYRQSVRLGVKPLDTRDHIFFISTELLR